MVGTRSSVPTSSNNSDEFPPPSGRLAFEMRQLASGGSGGRFHACCVGDDNSKAKLRPQWKFCSPIEDEVKPSCSAAETPVTSMAESPLPSLIPESSNVILPREHLKSTIEENFICRKCARASFYSSLDKVIMYLPTELDLHPCQSIIDSY